MVFQLSQEAYEALIALAQRGTVDPDGSTNQERALTLEAFLRDIEKTNGVIRHTLRVRWQDPTAPLPPGVRFPKTWPPELEYTLQFVSRAITKADVLKVVGDRTKNAVNVMVTPDPAGLLGWSKLDDYFVQA